MSDTTAVNATARMSAAWMPAFARQASAHGTEGQTEAGISTTPPSAALLLGAMRQGAERLAAEQATGVRIPPATESPQGPASPAIPTLAEPPGYGAGGTGGTSGTQASGRAAGNPGARLLQSMLELEALVNASSLETIRSRLAALTARHEALRAQCDLTGKTFDVALTAAEEASRRALQAQAETLADGSRPELAAFDAALDLALETERALQAAQEAMDEAVAFRLPEPDVVRRHTNASRLTEIMVVLQELLSKANTDTFRARSEFLGEMARVRREAAMKEAVEVERQLRKQERLNRLFGWLSRAFGWVLAALSFAAALFTGGASLVVAGVMLGLMVTDQIVSAATGVSLVGEAFQAMLNPLVEVLSDVFEKMMLGLGVDAATARLIAMVLASIVAIVVVIAATVAGAKVASRLLGPLLSKLAGSLASGTARILPPVVTRAAQQGGAALGKVGAQIRARLPGNSANAQVQGTRIAQLANTGSFVVGAMGAGGQLAVATLQMKASDAAARFVLLEHSLRVLQQMIDELLGAYAEGLHTLRTMMTTAVEALESEAQVGRFILHGMHRSV